MEKLSNIWICVLWLVRSVKMKEERVMDLLGELETTLEKIGGS